MHHAASARARWLTTARRPVLAGCSALLLVGGAALATSAFGKDTAYPPGYQQTLALTYTATAAGDVYDRDRIRTGDPVLLRLAKRLDVVVGYEVSGEDLGTVRGTMGLAGRVSSEGGWQRSVQLQEPRAFAASEAKSQVRVDLTPMVALARDVQRLSGGPEDRYRIDLVPQVRTNAALGDRVERLTLSPTIRFRLVGDSLELESPPATTGQPLVTTENSPGPRGAVRMGPSWWRMDVGTARLLAAAMLVLGLAALLGAALPPVRREPAEGPAAPATVRPRGNSLRLRTEPAPPAPMGRDASFDALMDEELEAGTDPPGLPAREEPGGRLARREAVPPLVVVGDPAEDDEELLYEDDLPEPDDDEPADSASRLDLGPLDFSQDDLVFPAPYTSRAADEDPDPVAATAAPEAHADEDALPFTPGRPAADFYPEPADLPAADLLPERPAPDLAADELDDREFEPRQTATDPSPEQPVEDGLGTEQPAPAEPRRRRAVAERYADEQPPHDLPTPDAPPGQYAAELPAREPAEQYAPEQGHEPATHYADEHYADEHYAPAQHADEQPTYDEPAAPEPAAQPAAQHQADAEQQRPAEPPAPGPAPAEALLDRYFPERPDTSEPTEPEQPARGRRRAAGPPDAPAVPRQRAPEQEEPAEEPAATLLDQGTPRPDLSPTPAPDRRPSAGRHRSDNGTPAPRIPRQAHRHRSDHPVT